MEQVETQISKVDDEEEDTFEKEKKKGQKESKKSKKKKTEQVVVEIPVVKTRPPEVEPKLEFSGLKNIKLTGLTQKIMGCIVGEHVTAEAPWTTISKVVVDENLYLHHESSDFLPVKDDLAEYTDPEILVGYDADYMPYEKNDFHRFYIAVTEAAKDMVLSKLEKERRLAEERLKNSINKRILPWVSLGSEKEVDDSIVKNSRPLIQLELETDIDELLKPVHFRDRNFDDAKDGYVCIGPGRRKFDALEKMRIDVAVQSVPCVDQNSAQTDPGLPRNAWTQYLYDMSSAKEVLKSCEVKELKPDHVFPEINYLEKVLEYNEYFDLYVNDYPLLVQKPSDNEVPHKSQFEEYEAYTDVKHCKNKLISAIAWHPMWSGIVALAYSVGLRCVIASDADLTGDEVHRDMFSKNYVLLWSFVDALEPRLILESPREVHALSWSPIDPNILVGGCVNGQIIIWDIKGKFEALEGREYLTTEQQKYRLVLHSLIGWLQPQPPPKYVRPAALSNLQFSHFGRVTKLLWMSPFYEFTENGHFLKAEVDDGKLPMQLITAGEDGVIMVWDLNKIPEDLGAGGRPRKKKIRKRPSALTSQISPFKAYDRKIRPIYMLHPELRNKVALIVTAFSCQFPDVKYKLYDLATEAQTDAVKMTQTLSLIDKEEEKKEGKEEEKKEGKEENEKEDVEEVEKEEGTENVESSTEKLPSNQEKEVALQKQSKTLTEKKSKTEKDEKKLDVTKEDKGVENTFERRRTYVPILEAPQEPPKKLIQFVTDEGDVVEVKWEGFDFHKGEFITTEEGRIESWGEAVHDGPVVVCERSPFLPSLVLTVGGRVTALWTNELKDQPLFWKYSPMKVTCGSWSPYRPCLFQVGRSDGSIEVWDLTKCSDSPSLVQSISGKVLTGMKEHSLPLQGNRGILGVADFNNSFRLLDFPEEYKTPKPEELETLKEFVNREIYLRVAYKAWNENFIKTNAEEIARIKALEAEAERIHKEAELAAEQEAQMRAKLEEEETKRFAKGKQGGSLADRFLERLAVQREKQMQRVLLEKKRLNKSDLLAKQAPILMMKQMEKGKRKKQREKIRHQQNIFDKTLAMLFPEVVEKPKEDPSEIDELEHELTGRIPELMEQYDYLLPIQLKLIKDTPFNKRLRWEKVFEEGMWRRNILDFPLYLRQSRKERYMRTIVDRLDGTAKQIRPNEGKKVKFGFKEGEPNVEEEEEEEEEEVEDEKMEEDDDEAGGEEPEAEPGPNA